jgi:hypothetical protein
MKGYARWGQVGQLAPMMERHALDSIEAQVRMEFEQELSSGQRIADGVLQDIRRVTWQLLAQAKEGAGVQPWRHLNWWREPTNPTRAVMYS